MNVLCLLYTSGSTFDINNYIKVVDNLDGEMMPSVEGSIDTLKLDEVQPLKLSVKDSSGNIVEGTLNVVVKDLSAPVITLKESSITISAGAVSYTHLSGEKRYFINGFFIELL